MRGLKIDLWPLVRVVTMLFIGVVILCPSFAAPAMATAAPADPNPQQQLDDLNNQLNDAAKKITDEFNAQKTQIYNDLVNQVGVKKAQAQIAAMQNTINMEIANAKTQLLNMSGLSGLTGALDGLKANIASVKGKIVNFLYPNILDEPFFPLAVLPTPTPPPGAVFRCGSCCSMPDKIAKHLIAGGDPLGEESLQAYMTRVMLPKVQNTMKSISPPITDAISIANNTDSSVRNAQMNTDYLAARGQKVAGAIMGGTGSKGVCRIASVARSLGASDVYSGVIQSVLMDGARDRLLMRLGANAGAVSSSTTGGEGARQIGDASDRAGRLNLYYNAFCNPADKNCKNTKTELMDRDVNFSALAGNNLQLKLTVAPALSDGGTNADFLTDDSMAVMAMGQNLYAHRLPIDKPIVANKDSKEYTLNPSKAEQNYLAERSLQAMRNVAQNSFAAFVAARAGGTGGNAASMKALMTELGAENPDIYGARPSYAAQMDALTRKLYTSDQFYKNLMEGQTNVERQDIAMQSIDLMNQRDIYKSLERTEMLMALWLEIKLRNGKAIKQAVTQ